MKTQLMIPAAGLGVRLGCEGPKALVEIEGTPLLVHTLRRLESMGLASGALILAPASHASAFKEIVTAAFPNAGCVVVAGGAERQDSVWNGLGRLAPETEIVVIHDAARPFVAADSVTASINAAQECGAATVAIPSSDTVLQADAEAYLVDTPDRRLLWMCQTPQTFRVPVIREAHLRAKDEGFTGTDDASLVRRMGGRVKLVKGTPMNFKVTTPADLVLAACVLREGLA